MTQAHFTDQTLAAVEHQRAGEEVDANGAVHLNGADHDADQGAHDAERFNGKNSRHVEGYEGVLLRSDVKTRLRAFKESVGAHEKHLERCLVTAAIEILLETPRLKEQWLDRMARAVATDTRLLLKTRQRNNKSDFPALGERS